MATAAKVVFILIEVVIFLTVTLVSIFMRKFLKPYERGYFRHDESLMHPFHPSTVTSVMMYTIGFLTPGAVVLITEAVYIKYNIDRLYERIKGSPVMKWICVCYRQLAFFIFGAATTHFLTNIAKYSIGRLRPHFFDVCKPDWSQLNDTSGYIEAHICTGTDQDLIKEARLSFPSGHSSMSMYCAIFLMLYLQKKLTWTGVALLLPLIQLVAFSLAFYTCLSRISDYKHHWSDTLAGGFLGVVIACVIVYKVNVVQEKERKDHQLIKSEPPSVYVDPQSRICEPANSSDNCPPFCCFDPIN